MFEPSWFDPDAVQALLDYFDRNVDPRLAQRIYLEMRWASRDTLRFLGTYSGPKQIEILAQHFGLASQPA
jgi:hypothetical protein